MPHDLCRAGFRVDHSGNREAFDWALLGIAGVWCLRPILSRREPRIRPFLLVLLVLILVYGWISVGNAKFDHDWDTQFRPADSSWGLSWLYGTLDREKSLATMLHLSAMVAGFIVVTDLSGSRTNRHGLMVAVALAGATVAMIGIFQKAAGSETMLFADDLILTNRHFFAAYRYHGNAATLLNFCWPVAAALFLRTKMRDSGPLEEAVWGTAAVFTTAAVLVNTSKMGQVLLAICLPFFLFAYRRSIFSAAQWIGPEMGEWRAGGCPAVGSGRTRGPVQSFGEHGALGGPADEHRPAVGNLSDLPDHVLEIGLVRPGPRDVLDGLSILRHA